MIAIRSTQRCEIADGQHKIHNRQQVPQTRRRPENCGDQGVHHGPAEGDCHFRRRIRRLRSPNIGALETNAGFLHFDTCDPGRDHMATFMKQKAGNGQPSKHESRQRMSGHGYQSDGQECHYDDDAANVDSEFDSLVSHICVAVYFIVLGKLAAKYRDRVKLQACTPISAFWGLEIRKKLQLSTADREQNRKYSAIHCSLRKYRYGRNDRRRFIWQGRRAD